MLGEIQQEQRLRKIYLNIKEGRLIRHNEDHSETPFQYVDGCVEQIFQKERTFRGEKVLYWYIDMRDRESNELYSLAFPYSSNVFKSIVLALVSDEALTKDTVVRIEPYKRNGYDKVTVWSDGVKLDWIVKVLPPIEVVTFGSKSVKDDSKRMQFINNAVMVIQKRIGQMPQQ